MKTLWTRAFQPYLCTTEQVIKVVRVISIWCMMSHTHYFEFKCAYKTPTVGACDFFLLFLRVCFCWNFILLFASILILCFFWSYNRLFTVAWHERVESRTPPPRHRASHPYIKAAHKSTTKISHAGTFVALSPPHLQSSPRLHIRLEISAQFCFSSSFNRYRHGC